MEISNTNLYEYDYYKLMMMMMMLVSTMIDFHNTELGRSTSLSVEIYANDWPCTRQGCLSLKCTCICYNNRCVHIYI